MCQFFVNIPVYSLGPETKLGIPTLSWCSMIMLFNDHVQCSMFFSVLISFSTTVSDLFHLHSDKEIQDTDAFDVRSFDANVSTSHYDGSGIQCIV